MPVPALLIDGTPASPAIAGALVSLVVRQALNAPALAVLTFADQGGALADTFPLGCPVAVNAPDGKSLIEAEVTTAEYLLEPGGVRTLRIHAYDRLHRLRKTQQVRALTDITIDDLLAQAAASIGVGTEVTSSAVSARPLLIQSDESDLDILVQAAERQGLYVRLAAGSFRALSLAGDGREPLHLLAGGNLYEAHATLSSEAMRQETAVQGWDWRHVAPIAGQASLAAQDANEIGPDVGAALSGRGKRVLVNRLVADVGEADAAAQADMDRAAALSATLKGGVARAERGYQVCNRGHHAVRAAEPDAATRFGLRLHHERFGLFGLGEHGAAALVEAVGDRLQVGGRLEVGLRLRRIDPAGLEGHRDLIAKSACRLLDRGITTEHDQVSHRNLPLPLREALLDGGQLLSGSKRCSPPSEPPRPSAAR